MGRLWHLARTHPRLTEWVALAGGMVAVLLVAVREVPLFPGQLAVLVVSTVVLAGLCVWIIHWEEQ